MVGFVKKLDDKKTMSFKVTDEKLLKKYTKIWGKISSLMNMKFDSEPVYGDNDKQDEECKNEIQKNKMENLINDDLEQISSYSDSANETDNESDNDESNE